MKLSNLLAGPFLYVLLGIAPGAHTTAALLENYAILDGETIKTAAPAELSIEVSMFESIGTGIALSIAQCESVEFCLLVMEESEIQDFIDLLAYRIDTLAARQQAGNSDGLNGIIGAYTSQRDNYMGYLQRLRSFKAAETSALTPGRKESIKSELDFFKDEELVDDEGLEALESSGP